MNIENLKSLVEKIEALRPVIYLCDDDEVNQGFNMGSFNFPCGSPSCIAGHACAIGYNLASYRWIHQNVAWTTAAAMWLEIDIETAEALFLGKEAPADIQSLTPSDAIAVINHLIETGEVDWNIVGYQPTGY